MLVKCVGKNAIHNTTSWLAYASWTWEVLRRNPDYISYYKSLRDKALETRDVTKSLSITQAGKQYPTAHKFGLLAPADPTKYAGEEAVFWHPNSFENVVRFHVIDPATVGRKNKPIQLSKFPGEKTHFIDANGTYHIRILGERFWFQMQCENLDFIAEDSFVGFKINHLENPEKRLKTMQEIGGIYDGAIPLNSRLHVPARLQYHQRSTLAYDIRQSGGSISDVVSAYLEAGLVVEDPEKFVDFTYVVQNALKGAKAYIYGDYLKILKRQ